MNLGMLRTRWAAVGAAVAVTLGAGGIGITHATTPAGATAFVPITPCRIVDTRPAPDTVGSRTSPLGPGETFTIAAHGDNGNCTGIPTTATGLELNVTALGATSGTFLTVWADGATQPTASSLNPQPGAPPIPNSVTTGLSSAGQFNVFNAVGSVNVIVDVVGYYSDHQHTGADIIDGSLTNADIADEPGIASDYNATATALPAGVTRVGSTSIRVPADGFLVAHATGIFTTSGGGLDMAWCQLTKGGVPGSLDFVNRPFASLTDYSVGVAVTASFSTHEVFEVDVADNPSGLFSGQAIGLDCFRTNGAVSTDNVQVTVTYYPRSYEPFIPIIMLGDEAAEG
jgi:hypothetical protein